MDMNKKLEHVLHSYTLKDKINKNLVNVLNSYTLKNKVKCFLYKCFTIEEGLNLKKRQKSSRLFGGQMFCLGLFGTNS